MNKSVSAFIFGLLAAVAAGFLGYIFLSIGVLFDALIKIGGGGGFGLFSISAYLLIAGGVLALVGSIMSLINCRKSKFILLIALLFSAVLPVYFLIMIIQSFTAQSIFVLLGFLPLILLIISTILAFKNGKKESV